MMSAKTIPCQVRGLWFRLMRADGLSSKILRCGSQGVPAQSSNWQPNALRLLKFIEFIHSHLDENTRFENGNEILQISQHGCTVKCLRKRNESGLALEMSDLFSLFFVTSG